MKIYCELSSFNFRVCTNFIFSEKFFFRYFRELASVPNSILRSHGHKQRTSANYNSYLVRWKRIEFMEGSVSGIK